MFPPIRNKKPKKPNQNVGICSSKPKKPDQNVGICSAKPKKPNQNVGICSAKSNVIQVKPKNGEFEEKPKKCFCF